MSDQIWSEAVAPTRYMLVMDNDGHWYVIPVDKWLDWDKFCGGPEYEAGDVPEYATALGGSYSLVTFTDPRIE